MHLGVEIPSKANWNPCTTELIESQRYPDGVGGSAVYLRVSKSVKNFDMAGLGVRAQVLQKFRQTTHRIFASFL